MAPNSILRLSRLYCRSRFPVQGLAVAASPFRLQHHWFCTTTLTGSSDDITVSYLVNSCGLSPEAAIEASHKVKLQSLLKPNSVLALLREYEFSDTQISTLVRKYPRLVLVDKKKNLSPKLEFFCSLGISRLDLARTLTYNPWILRGSLKNLIVPTCSLIKSVVLSDDRVVYILKHKSFIFRGNLPKNVIPNVELVRKLGMPQSCITHLMTTYANIMMRKPESFSQLVHQVSEMGFHPQKFSFVYAIAALSMKETTWKRCQEAYRRWGWSDDLILSAFRMYPLCMVMSEKKLMGTMDFLVNKMGWQSQAIAKYPHVLSYSLEKRIIPRFSVVRVLVLKGLIEEEKWSLATLITVSGKDFCDMVVNRYLSQVPQLLDVYQGKVGFQDM